MGGNLAALPISAKSAKPKEPILRWGAHTSSRRDGVVVSAQIADGGMTHVEAARIVAVLACCLLLPTPTQGPTPACAGTADVDRAAARLPAGQMLSAPAAEAGEEVLPVNLPAALRLANAQAWDIALAVHRLRIASAQLKGARVLWLPNLTGGVDYLHHDGPVVSTTTGAVVPDSSYGSLYAGVAPLAVVALTDALFTPLAQRQVTCTKSPMFKPRPTTRSPRWPWPISTPWKPAPALPVSTTWCSV